ncbi:MAG: DUF2812 domain-containing protein [Oscillospiraceae bacterium]|nr:DUF2812 domain-containing protein [Oscillospiraceae bacterium]
MDKTVRKIFTIADYEEEEIWLREQHKSGWKLVKMVPPCFYTFEQCEPEDVIYRLDYRDTENTESYFQMLSDFGWEYIGKCVGWFYFRKPACEAATEEDGELFSDNASRAEQVNAIINTRMLPVALIFLCCVLPNFYRVLNGEYIGLWGNIFGAFFCIMFALYVYIIVHCGMKLRKIKKKYQF